MPYALTVSGGWVIWVTGSLFNQRQELAILKSILSRIEKKL